MNRCSKVMERTGMMNNNKGFTLIELITVMAIMALLSGALFTLFLSGGKTYQVVQTSYKAQNEARIAMSYITVKIRQNDSVTTEGAITMHGVQVIDDKHLRIKTPAGMNWWIYLEGKQLKESVAGLTPIPTGGDVIADIEDLTFTASSASTGAIKIDIEVEYIDGTTPRVLKETVTLRSDP